MAFLAVSIVWILDCIRMPLATQSHFQSERLRVADTKPQRQCSDVDCGNQVLVLKTL